MFLNEAQLKGEVLSVTGQVDHIQLPADDETRRLAIRKIVEGPLEVVALPDKRYLICNAEAKLNRLPRNSLATTLAHAAQSIPGDDYIAGSAVMVSHAAFR